MNVIFYSFSKKARSTAQPSGSGTTIDCKLKDPTSIMQPVLLIASTDVVGKNYAYIADFGRYYYVTDMTYAHGLYEVTLNRDPFASFKTPIGDYTGMILRCSSTSAYDPMLADGNNAPTLAQTVSVESTPVKDSLGLASIFHAGGIYLLGVVGQPPTSDAGAGVNGISRYYFLTGSQMAQLAINMNDGTFLTSLKNQFTNPMEAITSCIFLPLASTSLVSTTLERIKLGSNDTGLDGLLVTDRFISTSNALTLPTGMTDVNYLNREPYAYASINLPFVGKVELPLDKLNLGSGVTVDTHIDVFTGDIMHVIRPTLSTQYYRYVYTGNISTKIQVTSQFVNALGVMSGVMQAASGVLTDNFVMAANGTKEILKSSMKQSQINGGNSSALGVLGDTNLTVRYVKRTPSHGITDAAAVSGLPYYKMAKVSTLPGFLVMSDANVAIDGTEGERDEIISGMNSGFYYE